MCKRDSKVNSETIYYDEEDVSNDLFRDRCYFYLKKNTKFGLDILKYCTENA